MEVKNYEIYIDYNHSNHTYSGEVKIEVDGNEKELILNTEGHDIEELLMSGEKVSFSKGRRNDEIVIEKELKGKSTLEVRFKAPLNKNLTGLYLAKSSDGSEMATTQFESIGARKAFPCFDEPKLKATFDLTITVSNELDVISNMEPMEVKDNNKKKTIRFQQTPRMSTYLLYIGIGKFETRESKFENVKLYLSGLRDNLDTTDFPLEIAGKCLKFFNNYFGIKYSLPKLHLISVPEFAAGAMENWGAITFRETAILVNKSTSGSTKKRVAAVIAHEIAHQWFGDLVTMQWWNDLWLNESFATFMMYKMVEEYYPEWKVTGDMLLTRGRGAFNDDSLESTHPIEANVKEPEEIEQIFDQISYGKGGMILRMIESYAGKEAFRKGLHNYLEEFSYSNAKGADLWRSIAQTSGKPVDKIMEAWVKREGYPVVNVKFEKENLSLHQERFFLNGKKSESIWPIPLTVLREGKMESLLMENADLVIEKRGFLKLNIEDTGFYRVQYPVEFYENIGNLIDKVDFKDLINILSDLYAFLVSGRIPLNLYLKTVRHFSKNEELNVVTQISNDLSELRSIIPNNKELNDSYLEFHKNQADRLEGKKDLDMNNSILYGTVLRRLVEVDEKKAMELSLQFSKIENEKPDIRDAIAAAYAKREGNFETMKAKMFSLKSDEDKVKILAAIGHITGEETFKAMNELINAGKIKKQDVASYFTSFGAYPKNRKLAFEKFSEMVNKLADFFSGSGTASNLVYALTPLVGLGRGEEMKEFLEKIKSPSIEVGIRKGNERLSINERVLERLNK